MWVLRVFEFVCEYIYIYVICIYTTEEKCRRVRDCFSFLLPSIILSVVLCSFFVRGSRRGHVFLPVRGKRDLSCFF